jgi:hypothetical protein
MPNETPLAVCPAIDTQALRIVAVALEQQENLGGNAGADFLRAFCNNIDRQRVEEAESIKARLRLIDRKLDVDLDKYGPFDSTTDFEGQQPEEDGGDMPWARLRP